VSIQQNISWLKVTMENSVLMSASDRARHLRHQPHTLVRLKVERWDRRAQASAGRVFHAEKRQALLAFAHLVNWQDVWMIEAGRRFRFTAEAHQGFVRVGLVSDDPFESDDPARVPLSGTVNHAHS